MKLGKLEKIDLRDCWKHEARDFTCWLSEQDNLELLGDELGIDIKLLKVEAGVGKFSADILAEEDTTGRKIVIENQLEATDHSHLGQILTYAAGMQAEYLIWIVKDAREEHVQAVEWINEHSSEKINFFLVQVELWRIGNSDPAPKFMALVRPNNWTKSLRGGGQESGSNLTQTRLSQLEFWQQLRDYAAACAPPLKLRTPRPQHWYDVAIGRSDCQVTLTLMLSEGKVGAEIYIPSSKQLFTELYARQQQVEEIVGIGELIWQELPEKKASRIRIFKQVNFLQEDRTEVFEWLVMVTRNFKGLFSKLEGV
jgi:Domain of unknown function (DUF4268)